MDLTSIAFDSATIEAGTMIVLGFWALHGTICAVINLYRNVREDYLFFKNH